MTQTKYIRLGSYNGKPCTEFVHWGRVIAIFPETTPDQFFEHDSAAKEFLHLLEVIYLREKYELLKKGLI
jgi:hypothetical protein